MAAQAFTLEQLDTALLAAGVTNFSARELTYLPKAKPPKCEIPTGRLLVNLLLVAILAQAIRTELGAPLIVSSAFRPRWYNSAVGGAPNSAHIRAAAVDLNATSVEDGERLRSISKELWNAREHEFAGLGFYKRAPRRVHVDVLHPDGKGHRRWWK